MSKKKKKDHEVFSLKPTRSYYAGAFVFPIIFAAVTAIIDDFRPVWLFGSLVPTVLMLALKRKITVYKEHIVVKHGVMGGTTIPFSELEYWEFEGEKQGTKAAHDIMMLKFKSKSYSFSTVSTKNFDEMAKFMTKNFGKQKRSNSK